MSTDHEREIRDRLGGALDTIAPPSPPVGAVLRQGRAIRVRRRVAVAAGLAAVVGAGGRAARAGRARARRAAGAAQLPRDRQPAAEHAEQADVLRDHQRPAVAVRDRLAAWRARAERAGAAIVRHDRPEPGRRARQPGRRRRRHAPRPGGPGPPGRQLPGPEPARRVARRPDRGPLARPAVGRRRAPGQPAAAHGRGLLHSRRGGLRGPLPRHHQRVAPAGPARPAPADGADRGGHAGREALVAHGLRRALGHLPVGQRRQQRFLPGELQPQARSADRVDGLRRRPGPVHGRAGRSGHQLPEVPARGRQHAAGRPGRRWRATGTSGS